jgi:hypothetical protein
MKKLILKFSAFSLFIGMSIITTSCQDDKVLEEMNQNSSQNKLANLKTAGPAFDGALFGKSIENYLNGKVAGYGYNVFHDGELVAANGGGWARKWYEENPTKHSYQQRQGIASSTKFITAVATVALLEKYKISLDAPVYLYMPTSWKVNESFKKITFKRILEHTAGLIDYGDTWAGYKKTAEEGINEIQFSSKARQYTNHNYSFMAIILASLEMRKNGILTTNQQSILENKDSWYSINNFGLYYRNIVRNLVFKKAGLLHWAVMDYTTWNNNGVIPAEQGTKGYSTVLGTEKGSLKGDVRLNGGSGGLYISPNEFGIIQLAVVEGKIISIANYNRMKNELLGFDGKINGKYGTYFWKNGASNNHETIIFDMGRTQIAIFANSQASDIGNDRSIVTKAYEAAWK